jgi:hypothetical protein
MNLPKIGRAEWSAHHLATKYLSLAILPRHRPKNVTVSVTIFSLKGGKDLKILTALGMLCLCKTTHSRNKGSDLNLSVFIVANVLC